MSDFEFACSALIILGVAACSLLVSPGQRLVAAAGAAVVSLPFLALYLRPTLSRLLRRIVATRRQVSDGDRQDRAET